MPAGDSWRPPRDDRGRDNNHRDDRAHIQDSYRPSDSHDSYQFRGAADRRPSRYDDDDDYSRDDRYPRRDHRRDDYRDDYRDDRKDNSYPRSSRREDPPPHPSRRPEENFSFRAPSGPSYPSQNQGTRGYPAPQRPQNKKHGRKEFKKNAHNKPRFFKKKQPHERDIFTGLRASTPEQLEGMGGPARFVEYVSSEEGEGDRPLRKKIKSLDAPEADCSVPKWSNPDPYTSLPPPQSLGAPKKDIVQVIRKSRVEQQAKNSDPAKTNQDFISFNDDDAMQDDNMSLASAASVGEAPPPNAPRDPKNVARGAPKGQENIVQSNGSSFTPINLPGLAKASSSQVNGVYGSSALPTLDQSLTTESPLVARSGNVGAAGRAPLPPITQHPLPARPSHVDLETGVEIPSASSAPSKKRKYDQVQQVTVDVVTAWIARPGQNSTPWHRPIVGDKSSPAARLHNEIQSFYDLVRPKDFEQRVRQGLIKSIEHAIQRSDIPGADYIRVKCFGSFAAGLYLPVADLDLVAVSPQFMRHGTRSFCQSGRHLRQLGAHLERSRGQFEDIIPITKARVPIIKFKDSVTGLRVDVSFENDSGLLANSTFREWKEDFPEMPILVVLIKQLVAMYGLNEVHTGGIGGFSIICLVVSMLQMLPKSQAHIRKNYGELLLHFLDLYGNKFDFRTTGIDMIPPGYFDKIRFPMARQNNRRLTIRDPNNWDNDISGGSRKIELIFDIFHLCHSKLQRRLAEVKNNANDTGSLLGCILAGNYDSFAEQRNKLYQAYYNQPMPADAQFGVPAVDGQQSGQYQAALQSMDGVHDDSSDLSSVMSVGVAPPVLAPEPPQAPATGGSIQIVLERKLAQDFKNSFPHITQVGSRLTRKEALILLNTYGEGDNPEAALTYEVLKEGRRREVKRQKTVNKKAKKKKANRKAQKQAQQQEDNKTGKQQAQPQPLTKRQRRQAAKREKKLERARLNEVKQQEEAPQPPKVKQPIQQPAEAKVSNREKKRRKWSHKTPPTRRSERLNGSESGSAA